MGKGGFGEVYLAEHKETGRQVDLKIYAKERMTLNDIELCRNEIEALKLCQHPNIIRLFDVLENSQYLILAMELLKGGDILDRIGKKNNDFSEKIVAKHIFKLAKALDYFHEIGIIHRDMKPENILFADDSPDSDLKITDFGLAALLNHNEKQKGFAGTLVYTSPEVLLGLHYDKAVDLWGLGMVTYIMLCGRKPLSSSVPKEVIKNRILKENFDYESERWSSISIEAKKFVNRTFLLCCINIKYRTFN